MSDRLFEMIRRVVQHELAHQRTSLLGVVTDLFPHEAEDDDNNYEVNVRLKHEDLELRRVPMTVSHVGVAAPARVGDLVLVQFVNGDLNQPVINGRFYHADERPPLHRADEVLFEQRVPDGTLNHLRFTDDGTIYLQRDVSAPEDNSDAKTSVKIDGATGDIEITAGPSITVTITNDASIEIIADGKPIDITCDTLTLDGNLHVTGTADVDGVVTIGGATKTEIDGNQITGM